MNTILAGDCLSVMPTLPANSVDSIITDPPYGLDFMGKSWDHGVPGVEFWQSGLRVAKSGAILMAFGGTRTYHRLTCAIEDAGWEIRDGMCWLYGSGFPKSLDISKAIDKAAGAERFDRVTEAAGISGSLSGPRVNTIDGGNPVTPAAHLWQGWGTALKPAWEPIIVAMKPFEGTYAENAQKWGVAGLNIDGGRIAGVSGDGHWGKAVHAPDRSPFSSGTEQSVSYESNAQGRWPANLLLDEEAARLLDEQSGELSGDPIGRKPRGNVATEGVTCFGTGQNEKPNRTDHGGASRFFYTAKASSSERNAGLEDMEEVVAGTGALRDNGRQSEPRANVHPTVKPVSLMRYLCKLTRTPTGGVVLDPFMGSGTTGIACVLEHRDFIGIEIDAAYANIARKRIDDMSGPLFVTA